MSEIVVGEVSHGEVVATLLSGKRLLACRCRAVVHEDRFRSHVATHRRESVVYRISRESNERMAGRDFDSALEVVGSRPRKRVRSSRSKR